MFKKYRLKANLTQEQLAEKVGISWRQMQRIETKINTPKLQTFAKLVDTLNISKIDVIKYLKEQSNEAMKQKK